TSPLQPKGEEKTCHREPNSSLVNAENNSAIATTWIAIVKIALPPNLHRAASVVAANIAANKAASMVAAASRLVGRAAAARPVPATNKTLWRTHSCTVRAPYPGGRHV